MVAATLRPETMYGQTNCWLHPDIKYIAWQISRNNEVWISTRRAARNMTYQGFTAVEGDIKVLAELTGQDLLTNLKSPLTVLRIPMDNLLGLC